MDSAPQAISNVRAVSLWWEGCRPVPSFDASERFNRNANGVFYFIDHDFDGARGQDIDETIFVTDRYSVENYLVSREVLEELLKDEFHLDGLPEVRRRVVALFNTTYDLFVAVTRQLNF